MYVYIYNTRNPQANTKIFLSSSKDYLDVSYVLQKVIHYAIHNDT